MHPYRDILWGLLASLAGFLIIAFPTTPFSLGGSFLPLGWLYQLLVGGVMVLAGIFTSDVANLSPKLFPKQLYSRSGIPVCIAGLVVVANFDRYEEVLSRFGVWPMYLIGAGIAFCGLVTLVHYLTVFQPSPTSTGLL